MLSSILMTSAMAAAVLASPLQHFDKRTLTVVDTVTAAAATVTKMHYVTAPAAPAAQPVVNKEADTDAAAAAPQAQGNGGWGVFGKHNHVFSQASEVASQAQAPKSYPPQQATTTTTTPVQQSSAAASQPDSGSSAAPTSYQDIAVYHHNLHRANHSASDLAWSDDLASSAQTIAETCVYAHKTDVAGGGYGQNIAAGVEPNNISAIITDLFYNGEEPYYTSNYGQANPDMTNFEKWGHFSQIVWKSTTHVGCYTQHCPGGLANVGPDVSPYFTACNYKNPGNYGGEYADNVMSPQGHPSAQWNTGLNQ